MISIWSGFIILGVLTRATIGGSIDGRHGTVNNRIYYGEDARITDYPYHISIMTYIPGYGFMFTCGGSILSKNVIATAAHCVEKIQSPSEVYILAGTEYPETGGVVRYLSQIIIHDLYHRSHMSYDIALLVLTADLIFSPAIQPIQLATSDLPDGTFLTATGWGRTEFGVGATKLQVVKMPIINQMQCSAMSADMTPVMLCTGYLGAEIKGTCRGDSGGPLVFNGKLYGITSFLISENCMDPYPSFNVRVAAVYDWIASKMFLLSHN